MWIKNVIDKALDSNSKALKKGGDKYNVKIKGI